MFPHPDTIHPFSLQVNGAGDQLTVPSKPVACPPKRQRRHSVRLGKIGDQPTFDNHRRPKPQQWKYTSKDSKATKTRQLMNLSGAASIDYHQSLDPGIENNHAGKLGYSKHSHNHNSNKLDCVAIGGWGVRDSAKLKRGFSMTKRVISNWGSKMDDEDERFEEEDDYDDADRYSNYERDGSGSHLKYQSLNLDGVVRVSDGVELNGPSDTDGGNWGNL